MLKILEASNSMTQGVLIIGAPSAIAEAAARQWAERGTRLFLVGRRCERLEEIAKDLEVRGAKACQVHVLDVNDQESHDAMLDACWGFLGHVDVALIAHGTLPDQRQCEYDPTMMSAAFQTNATHVLVMLSRLSNRFESQGKGVIAAISSVAGDRGRPSNYVYGAAKGALTLFLEGMRARLAPTGVHVLTIKPGFVDTPMTQDLSLPKPLVATPAHVASDIVKAIAVRRNVLYTPWFWRWVMWVIRAIPEPIFKRLKL